VEGRRGRVRSGSQPRPEPRPRLGPASFFLR
jgi:hypothetical protein